MIESYQVINCVIQLTLVILHTTLKMLSNWIMTMNWTILQYCILIILTVAGMVNSKSDCRAAFTKDVKIIAAQTNTEISFIIPDNADLTSGRNMHHSVPINMTNHGDEPVTLLIVYDEDFPTQDLLSDFGRHTHVELVKSISPDKVTIDTNETVTIQVNFFIPDFVPVRDKDPYRSKVTVSVKKMLSNITDITEVFKQHWKKEVSFYLAVMDKKLSDYDQISPYCELRSCPDTDISHCSETTLDNCESRDWHAEFLIHDNITGLKHIELQQDAESISKRFSIGTNMDVVYRVRSTCCQTGVVVTAVDMAGNSEHCVAGVYPSLANPVNINRLLWLLLVMRTISIF